MPFSQIPFDQSASRRAKIVATVGPASNSDAVFRKIVRAGADVVRLNFSHGSHEDMAALIQMIRKVSQEESRSVCILADMQGPKIRTSTLKDHQPVLLKAGQKLTITPRDVPGTATLVGTTFLTLADNVEQGSRILLSDGLIELRVHEIVDQDVVCDIVNGGMLGEKKGINLPGIAVRVSSLTEKDSLDLEFALKAGVDAVAVSFVRSAEDVRLVRDRVTAYGGETWLVAKLEKPQAITNLDAILEVADAIMVARGDLGVEVPPEQVPALQKQIIRRAADYHKPVITATQMLESMIENPRPTRAEVSDVANAIYDGTDAVMLSGESAAGKYPVEAVAMMSRIVSATERHMRENNLTKPHKYRTQLSIAETICEAAAQASDDLDVRGIAMFTESGSTARQISKYHPSAPIYALSPLERTCNRVNLLWGVTPLRCPKLNSTEAMVDYAESSLAAKGFARRGDVIAIVAGTRTKSGSTNFLRLHALGENLPEAPRFCTLDESPEAAAPGCCAAKPQKAAPKSKPAAAK